MSYPYGQQPYGQQPYGPPPLGQPAEVPLSQPLYGATIGQSVRRFWKKYATFSGRAGRGELWWWFLVSYLISVALGIVGQAAFGPQPQPVAITDDADIRRYLVVVVAWAFKASSIAYAWQAAILVGWIALSARRLHDTNRSGWWTLIGLVPLVGPIILIVFWASPSEVAGQRYDRVAA